MARDADRGAGRLSLDATWRYEKTLVGPWPAGPLLAAVALLGIDLTLLAVLAHRRRRLSRASGR